MVHPADIIRSPSDVGAFAAPAGSVRPEHDCGLSVVPWTRAKLARYNRNTVFVSFVCALAVLHACATSYFVGTAKLWRLNYRMSEAIAEWLVYLGPILGGLCAPWLSHYGEVIHRPCYVGGLAMLHAVGGWLLVLPELYHPQYSTLAATAVLNQTLCRAPLKLSNLESEEFDEGKWYIALTIMAAYQLLHGLAFVSMVSHGVAHIDDGSNKYMTPVYICLIVGVSQIGRFVGLNLTLVPVTFNRNVFFSFGKAFPNFPKMLVYLGTLMTPYLEITAWLMTMTGLFVFGFLTSLFAKLPEKMLLRQGVNTLLARRSGIEQRSRDRQEETDSQTKTMGFFSSVAKLLTSSFVLLNTAAATFMHVAVVNFGAMREEFFRSRFIDFADDFDYRFSFYNVSALIFMLILLLLMGQVFSRRRPTTKFYVVWLIVSYVAVLGLFSSYAFLKCEDRTALMKYDAPVRGCNDGCDCRADVFDPVCLAGKTYYSACFAGCRGRESDGQGATYTECACGASATSSARAGSCNRGRCKVVAFFAEANNVIALGLMAGAYVVHILIALRSVAHHQLRSHGIGLLLIGIKLLPFLPFKIIYEVIKAAHCKISHQGDCFIFGEHFALVITLVTIGFMILSIILTCCMLRGAGQVQMYKRRGSKQLGQSSMRFVPENGHNGRIEVLDEDSEEEEERQALTLSLSSAQGVNNVQNGRESPDIDEEQIRRTENHHRGLRESLQQVMASAVVASPTPQEPLLDVEGGGGNVSSKESLYSFNSQDPLEEERNASEEFADTDIDFELSQIDLDRVKDKYKDKENEKRPKNPKCLKSSPFSETDF